MRETVLQKKIQQWEDQLLDLGKRNKMISFRETRRTTLQILQPEFDALFQNIVVEEKELTFQRAIDRDTDARMYSVLSLMDRLSVPMDVRVGDIRAAGSLSEIRKTLKNLRSKARLALDEQGANILYLVFGFLEWREKGSRGDSWIRSPLILAPACLSCTSLNGQYSLKKHEDEVAVNPTLAFLLQRDYGLTLPEFDPDKESAEAFLQKTESLVVDRGWRVVRECSLGLVSFLKISMYHDLIRHEDQLKANPIIRAFAGEENGIRGSDVGEFDHDACRSMDSYQVLDADSSQQDAILLSRKGVSFVVQGPPGTGKSQTITNMIAQGLADGKKILFVSEKMAALDVVYRRLTDVQLADFCLSLHSHKANKKEILAQLGDNLNLQHRKVKDEEIAKLTRLDVIREQLKSYVTELHKTVMPLEMSLYEVYGAILELGELPDIPLELPDARQLSKDQVNRLALLTENLQKAQAELGPQWPQNPWRGITCQYLSTARKKELYQQLQDARAMLLPLNECRVGQENLGDVLSLGKLDGFLALRGHERSCREIPDEWFSRSTIQEERLLGLLRDQRKLLDESQRTLAEKYGGGFYLLKNDRNFPRFASAMGFFRRVIHNASAPSAWEQSAKQILSEFRASTLPELEDAVENTAPLAFGDWNHGLDAVAQNGAVLGGLYQSISELRTQYRIKADLGNLGLLSFLRDHREEAVYCEPNLLWADADKDTRELLARVTERAADLTDRHSRLTEIFEDTVFSIDCDAMLARFKTEYTSFLKHFKSSYQEDMRQIRLAFRTVRKKISDEEVIKLLQTLRQYREDLEKYNILSQELSPKLGVTQWGIRFDWRGLKNRMDAFWELCAAFESPEDTVRFLSEASWERAVKLLERFERLNAWFAGKEISEFIGDLSALAAIRTAEETYTETFTEAQARIPFADLSGEGELTRIGEALDHMKRMKEILESEKIGGELRKWVTRGIPELDTDAYAEQIAALVQGRAVLEDITQLFSQKSELENGSLGALAESIQAWMERFDSLDGWIAVRDCQNACRDAGIGPFIRQAEQGSIPEGRLKDVFLKSFYFRWIEQVCADMEAVASFRVLEQNTRVETFRELDAHRLPVDQMRIRERLIREMPGSNSSGRAADEMSILRKELGKKRNIMPLRKLFRSIPNLLLRLKPCLMMSPLSVSYFLEADTYRFDMVIFDEASQIFPQDAIGAIFRGAQVIIAGDSKQLPPTNFFAASMGNGPEMDVDDEDAEDIVYDSILEEAAGSLPNRSLLWHYRSRSEDLISFSNREIYRNELITFPSSLASAPDTGVEYVHVPEGVYENRCNQAEAREIVRLVWEHIRVYPERSLGVIAFSESQQTMIEEELYEFRTQHPENEGFFDENKDEPFFVKNLENVQGDERDTIIFSICYGKNAQGKMYMRFGPLGHQGGERRLNVAITRAKQNVKLVGSILPEDIDLSKTQAEGVKMLRDYIDFAIHGSGVLTKRKRNSLYDTDVFREQVAEFLREQGCKLRMNVGSSDYTVDIAVEDPEEPGRFLAGIECDGSTYAMARTVRDRDHLRTAVLERMGWKMYRVWSTEWIRNPRAEQERLMAFLRTAGQPRDGEKPEDSGAASVDTEIVERGQEKLDARNPYGIAKYREGKWWDRPARWNTDPLADAADMIYAVLKEEQPIHMELLYKRVSGGFSAGKATQSVRDTVDEAIRQRMQGAVVVEDRFVRLVGLTTVQPKRSEPGNPDRSIEHISIPEIAAAMERILAGAYGMERSVLCLETAKVFGFERMGPKIRQRTGEAIDLLAHSRRISVYDDKIQLLEG